MAWGSTRNDGTGNGSHLPNPQSGRTAPLGSPTDLRSKMHWVPYLLVLRCANVTYRRGSHTPAHLLLRTAPYLWEPRLATSGVVWSGIPPRQDLGLSCNVGVRSGLPECSPASTSAQTYANTLGPRRRTDMGLLRDSFQHSGVSVPRRDPYAHPATLPPRARG